MKIKSKRNKYSEEIACLLLNLFIRLTMKYYKQGLWSEAIIGNILDKDLDFHAWRNLQTKRLATT